MSQLGLIGMDLGANFSPCRTYRYTLHRQWSDGPGVAWLMFNPSTADESQDDPTIRKCRGFSQRWSYGRMVIVNLFAIRGTDPRIVKQAADPVGPENDERIFEAVQSCRRMVCAWGCGAHFPKEHRDRPHRALRMIDRKLPDLWINCLGRAKDGSPRHPLMLPYTTQLESFEVDHGANA